MVKGKAKNVAPLKEALQEGAVKDGRYHCFVQSYGITGKEWIGILTQKGFPVEPSAKSVLCSPDFKVTSGERSIIVIFNLNALQKVINTPEFKNYAPPTAEMAPMLRDKLKGPELKALRIERLAIGHEPIVAHDGLPRVLVVCYGTHGQRLSSLSDKGNGKLHGVDGYAYVKIR
ncbi:MAG: hypothetical protein A3B07_00340 [Candidatus Yonathbacteria bacterium RIFCSPLOWO2_01_FULL_43_27]|uniref:Uncharacterized protein n=1 Tax=Candidatus Yonathbacteria bacterium RIFCSPLOWO2_01_FULL_43_27 TaxID=1802726 RepID=A0A1G2SE10_9BACT|nr:MAG: hypothetical protein A2658_01000 [Candidatus Yonathbacteria bacterium RIFCSPHIGHO2_01_FULL_44_19]OHA83204.1 MAG: hypothetical protein A3B07_00340 [Candidatus Yonathbacteria bacterium RIFCSPLOWO2_01_FULL_43_27]